MPYTVVYTWTGNRWLDIVLLVPASLVPRPFRVYMYAHAQGGGEEVRKGLGNNYAFAWAKEFNYEAAATYLKWLWSADYVSL